MHIQEKLTVIVLYFVILIGISAIMLTGRNSSNINNTSYGKDIEVISDISENIFPRASSKENYNNIEALMTAKIADYDALGYFPTLYGPSLQATYYAIYILNAIDKLDTINTTQITNFILSKYNESEHLFIDECAERFLNLDFSTLYMYYPYSTLLEVNCYAILTFDMLGKLNLIDVQDAIDFIWSCYNPSTSGFIGRPYMTSPDNEYRISTMDNTYFAILTLDLLMDDWNGYNTQKSELITYINSLQSDEYQSGGFWNALDTSDFESMEYTIVEPNIFSSYYCIKSLELFGMEDTIDVPDFFFYLDELYNEDVDWFQYYALPAGSDPEERLNVPSSAIGLELSDIYGFTNFDRPALLNFIFSNRTSWGSWEQCSAPGYHELIDSYQVIRSLVATGELSQLAPGELDELSNAMNRYFSGEGYTLLSHDYTRLSLLYTIVNSFDLYGRIGELDIQKIYDIINTSTFKNIFQGYNSFLIGETEPLIGSHFIKLGIFRTYPIEYSLPHRYNSLLTIFKALDILQKIFKLDDFDAARDLNDVMIEVINSQYLNDTESNYGGFMADSRWNNPWWDTHPIPEEWKNNDVHFEYSYWAITSLKIISDYKELGDYESMGVDTQALYSHIIKNIIETPSVIYYPSEYSNNPQDFLEHTYYMLYILNELDMYTLNTQKIRNFVEQSINYTNIKNIYYCYKISELLDLDISFDLDLTYELIETIYSPEFNEYYLTTANQKIDQNVFYWICDMAMNDEIKIIYQYSNPVSLGETVNLTATLRNIVLEEFGSYIYLKFESTQVGTLTFIKQPDCTFNVEIPIPDTPSNYPSVQGNIVVYSGIQKIQEVTITIQTLSNELTQTEDSDDDKGSSSKENPKANEPIELQSAIPIMITIIAIPASVIAISTKIQRNLRQKIK
ncbi:MAG: prenyltransferase/squalene oxidase repeat-containing protein [Promethearchaeota archaeon]